MTRWRHLAACCAVGSLLLPVAAFAQINTLLAQGEARINDGAQAQQRVDNLADQAAALLSEYRTELKVIDGLGVYNDLLQRQIDNQEAEKEALADSMNKIALIERQIVPLMISMIDRLDEFVEADVPFLLKERRDRVQKLRNLMERSDVTAAEQFRRVLEAYSIEMDYGRTIESYKATLENNGTSLEGEFLRFGRVSLVFRTVSGDMLVYNTNTGEYEDLPASTYNTAISQGLKVAKKQTAPDLVIMPVSAPEEAGE
ncbi:MAG: DUF3450 domain-containing protein [Gammaproteobacteria bacterium]|nr:DUF3450 domain-containing protein [Gammaproteobacteria bacterium]NND59833.1 DUF3450 domain-containing protein [Gammaproteobacteria bacterium]